MNLRKLEHGFRMKSAGIPHGQFSKLGSLFRSPIKEGTLKKGTLQKRKFRPLPLCFTFRAWGESCSIPPAQAKVVALSDCAQKHRPQGVEGSGLVSVQD